MKRRWLRWLAVVVAVVLLVRSGHGLGSVIGAAMIHRSRDGDGRGRRRPVPLPSQTISCGGDPSPLPSGTELVSPRCGPTAGTSRRSGIPIPSHSWSCTEAELVSNATSTARSKTLSDVVLLAKSFLSPSIRDPSTRRCSVTDRDRYVPELAQRDASSTTSVEHLLTMSSGIRYEEQSLPLPWGDDVNTYYGTDLRDLALNGTEIERAPGQEWHYNNYSPLLLGLVLERSTGMSVSEYIATRLWQPLGAGRACGVSRLGLRRWKAASTRHRSTTRASAS